MSSNQRTRKNRSRIDDEIVALIKEEMRAQGMLQKDLAAATGMTQPQVSVRLSKTAASIPVKQVILMCGALGLDPTEVMRTAEERAAVWQERDTPQRHELSAIKQIEGLGRRLAESLWDGCHDEDFIPIAINQIMAREDREFWTAGRKQLVLMHALADLATVIGARHPLRDSFLLEQEVENADITA